MSVGFASSQRQLFLKPVEPWTSLTYQAWNEKGRLELGFTSGEREWKQRAHDLSVEDVPDSPTESDFPEIAGIGRVRMNAGIAADIELPLPRPAVCSIEISPLEEDSFDSLQELLGDLLDPAIAEGIRQYGKSERLIRFRSEKRALPKTLIDAGTTCLDLRMPTITPRYGDTSKIVRVAQRWLRLYFSDTWVVALWSPPVPAQGRPWRSLPRQRRIGSGMESLTPPAGISGPSLAMTMIQEVGGIAKGSIGTTEDELALWEQCLMRGSADGLIGSTADLEDLECLSVQLSGFGKFLWDVGEDIVMLKARGKSEPSLPEVQRKELVAFTRELDKQLVHARDRLRQAFDLLTAATSSRRLFMEQQAQDRRRHLEILIGLLAAAAVVPGIVLAAAQVYSSKGLNLFGASLGLALIGTFGIAFLLVRLLKKEEPLKGLEEQLGTAQNEAPQEATVGVAKAAEQRAVFEWDPEW